MTFCLLFSPTLATVPDHWEDHALTIWTFVGRVMSLVFNTLSRFVMVAQTVKRLPAMWKTWVQSVGQEDPLEKETATHSRILAWKSHGWRRHSMGSQRVRRLSDFHFHFFLPRSNCLLNSWLQSLSAVILEPKKKKSVTASSISPYICHKVMRLDAMILVFLIFSFKPALSLSSFTLIKRLFSSSSLSAIRLGSSMVEPVL